MKQDDDLEPPDQAGVRRHAMRLLSDADAKGRFPTPIADLLTQARVVVVDEMIDESYVAALCRKARERGANFLRAIGKVLGLAHPDENVILIDPEVHSAKKPFLKLHETGHIYMPHQRQMYSLMLDCKHNLEPETRELFEREANSFASEVLFQVDGFTQEAEDHAFALRVPLDLSKKYGASVYSAVRRYVGHSQRCCAVVVLETAQLVDGVGLRADVRRVVTSASFKSRFDATNWPTFHTSGDTIGSMIPVGKQRMSRPRNFSLTDRNGVRHECVAEAFKTKWNVMVLIHVQGSLTSKTIIVPSMGAQPNV